MTGKEHTIFKSYLFWTREEEEKQKECIRQMVIEDAEEYGEEEVDLSDDNINRRFWEDIDMFYDDEKMNLNKTLPNNIIAIADAGFWYGRRKECKIMGNNLNEVLYSGDCDDIYVYCDRYDVCSVMAHHDNNHYVTYRMVKDGVDIDNFLDKVYNGTYTKKDITRYTQSLKPFVKQIYGF